MLVNNTSLERKRQAILAAIDEYAPVMQAGIRSCLQMQAVKDTITALQDYPHTCKIRRFAFVISIPDYCAAAVENLLKLVVMQAAPNNLSLLAIGDLLGIALEYLHKV